MKLAFAASSSAPAQEALKNLTKQYGQCDIQSADAVVALGGDGKVLKTLYDVLELNKPVYAMRRTESVGFLCNDYNTEDLPVRIAAAHKVMLYPLFVDAKTVKGKTESALAINEVSIIRETPQSARLRIIVDS